MTVLRQSAGPHRAGRTIVSALCLAGLLTTLAGCAGGDMAGGVTTPASATAPPAAPAATTAAAPKAAAQVLTRTEINEQCWMSDAVNKMKDLDSKAKYVDKCVAEKLKAQQGM